MWTVSVWTEILLWPPVLMVTSECGMPTQWRGDASRSSIEGKPSCLYAKLQKEWFILCLSCSEYCGEPPPGESSTIHRPAAEGCEADEEQTTPTPMILTGTQKGQCLGSPWSGAQFAIDDLYLHICILYMTCLAWTGSHACSSNTQLLPKWPVSSGSKNWKRAWPTLMD